MSTTARRMTSRKIYGVLRSNGYVGRDHSSRWPVVTRDSDTHVIWFTVTYQSYEGQRGIPAQQLRETIFRMWTILKQRGVVGVVSEDGTSIRIEE